MSTRRIRKMLTRRITRFKRSANTVMRRSPSKGEIIVNGNYSYERQMRKGEFRENGHEEVRLLLARLNAAPHRRANVAPSNSRTRLPGSRAGSSIARAANS